VELDLSRDEGALLAEVLRTALKELRSEVYHTGDYALHQDLKLRAARVAALMVRLELAMNAPVGPASPPVEVMRCDAARS
jgi:hypothetical protein